METKNKRTIFCICGRTASGKDKIANDLVKSSHGFLKEVVSFTTRPKRDTELNGREHYFVSKEIFDEVSYNEKIAAYTEISGYEYMATVSELHKSNVYIIDPVGIQYLREVADSEGLDIFVIYVYATPEIRDERAKGRSDYETEYKRRCDSENKSFTEMENNKEYDLFIDNSGYEERYNYALNEVKANVFKILLNEVVDLTNMFVDMYVEDCKHQSEKYRKNMCKLLKENESLQEEIEKKKFSFFNLFK